MSTNFRQLTEAEKYDLEKQGCICDNWNYVIVAGDFSVERVFYTRFAGKVKIGLTDSGGIYNSFLEDCTLGRNIYLSDVKLLRNYNVRDNCSIINCGEITTEGTSTFGNGTEIEILNEGGGRELIITDALSSQIAWMAVSCRHDTELIRNLNKMAEEYIAGKSSNTGVVEEGAVIENCSVIRNVYIGSHAVISGASHLEEGTIESSAVSVTKIGEDVIAKNFIILDGSVVDGGAIIDKCFIGQAVKIGKQFSARDSAIFSNSELFHGEATSIFAGPFTVSHHKSTLLIAGMFSFYNAGSASNQSNHMYKLGPVHQGTLERGSKTASFSYLLWPTIVGPFSVVMGKHPGNFSTSDFPFSYITVENGKSFLTPAMNLITVGTRRDYLKWPARDSRKSKDKKDMICFELLNPWIMGKILRGMGKLRALYDSTPKERESVFNEGVYIKRLMLKTGIKYYELAIKVYLGTMLIRLIDGLGTDTLLKEISEIHYSKEKEGTGNWVDMSGLFIPLTSLLKLIEEIKSGGINGIAELQFAIEELYNNYPVFAINWYIDFLYKKLGKEQISPEDLISVINDWKINAIKLNNMILTDASKEFDASSRTGYGITDNEDIINKDFYAVRGSLDENRFVRDLKDETIQIEKNAGKIIEKLKGYLK